MAHFTQTQCDASSITREKRLTDGTFKDWVIRIHDENGNYYEYVDSSAPENRALDTHKTEIHKHLQDEFEVKQKPVLNTTEAAETL